MHYQLRPPLVPRVRTEMTSPFLFEGSRSGLLEHACISSAFACLCPSVRLRCFAYPPPRFVRLRPRGAAPPHILLFVVSSFICESENAVTWSKKWALDASGAPTI